MSQERYVDPVAQRYASSEMQVLFSPLERAKTWRDVWIALARVEQKSGLPVAENQVKELEKARGENLNKYEFDGCSRSMNVELPRQLTSKRE